jgi:hypothetical protein
LILETVGQPAFPVYAGDGANDTAAVEAVNALGGITIGVGPSAPPAAHHRVGDPAELVRFLGVLADALGEAGAALIAPPLMEAAGVRPVSTGG